MHKYNFSRKFKPFGRKQPQSKVEKATVSKSTHSFHSSDPKMLAEMLLKQIRCEGQQIREDIERHKQNYLSISNNPQSSPLKVDSSNSKPPICKLCLQVDGAKVALICQGCHFFIINFKKANVIIIANLAKAVT